MHPRSNVSPGQRQRFAQIEERSKLLDGLLPFGDLLRRGGRGQPASELRFAGARPGDRQQLEERAGAEQIEIVRVQVVVVAKAIAGRAGARPAVFDSGQASLVERNCPRGLVTLADHGLVPAQEDDEGDDRHEQKPGAQDLLPCEHTGQHSEPEYAEPARS